MAEKIVRTNLVRYLKENSGRRDRVSFIHKTPYATFKVWPIQGRGNDWRVHLIVPGEEDLPQGTS